MVGLVWLPVVCENNKVAVLTRPRHCGINAALFEEMSKGSQGVPRVQRKTKKHLL